jgi:hypothetical protein
VLYTSNGAPLFAFGLPIGAVFGVAAFVRERRLDSARRQWPTAAGIITNSSVIEEAIEERNNADKSFIRTTGLFLMFLIRVGFGNQTAGRPAGRFPAGRNGGIREAPGRTTNRYFQEVTSMKC